MQPLVDDAHHPPPVIRVHIEGDGQPYDLLGFRVFEHLHKSHVYVHMRIALPIMGDPAVVRVLDCRPVLLFTLPQGPSASFLLVMSCIVPS